MVSHSVRQAQRFLNAPVPGLDERLGLGVAVAAAAVGDPACGQVLAEAPRGELRPVVGPERQTPGRDRSREDSALDAGDRLVGAGAHVQGPAGDFPGAAVHGDVQVDPAVRRGPDLGHVQVPQLVGAPDPEVARPAAPVGATGALQQPVGAHDALDPLAVDRLAQRPRGQGCDHPGPVDRVRAGDLDDRVVAWSTAARAGAWWAAQDRSVERLAAHASDACDDGGLAPGGDHGAGPGHPGAHVQPRESSPATSSS